MVDKEKNQPDGQDMNKIGGMHQSTIELPFSRNPRAGTKSRKMKAKGDWLVIF